MNIKYYTIYNKLTGEIIRTGSGSQEMFDYDIQHLSADEDYIEEAASAELDIINPVTKTVLKNQKPKPAQVVKDYAEVRYGLYPSVQEQLDMLWHAMDQGQMPKVEPFYSSIKAIKQAVPKDNSVAKDTVVIHNITEGTA